MSHIITNTFYSGSGLSPFQRFFLATGVQWQDGQTVATEVFYLPPQCSFFAIVYGGEAAVEQMNEGQEDYQK